MTPSVLGAIRPEFSKLSILRTLWKGRGVIILVWLLVTIGSGLYIRRMQSIYSADASILVQPPRIAERYVSSDNSEVLDRLATVRKDAVSNRNLEKIIDDLHLYAPERGSVPMAALCEKMRSQSWISQDKNWMGNHTMQLHAGFLGTDPRATAAVANRLADLFIKEEINSRASRAEGTSEFLGERLVEAKTKLDSLEGALTDYKVKHHGALPQQENTLLATVSGLQHELQASDTSILRARQTKAAAESSLAVAQTTLKLLEESANDPETSVVLESLRSPSEAAHPGEKSVGQSVIIQNQIDQLHLRYGDEHPEIRRLKAELLSARRFEREEANGLSSPTASSSAASSSALAAPVPVAGKETPVSRSKSAAASRHALEVGRTRERVASLEAQVASADTEIAKLTQTRDRLSSQVDGYQSRIAALPIREQEISQLLRDYEISKTNYTSLLSKKLSAEMATDFEQQQDSQVFTIISPAIPASAPMKPNRPMLLAVSSSAGLFLGLAMVIGFELKRGAFLGEWELPAGTVVLARLPVVEIFDSPESATKNKSGLRRGVKGQQAVLVSCGVLLLAAITGMLLMGRPF